MPGIPIYESTYCPVCAWKKLVNSIISLKKTTGVIVHFFSFLKYSPTPRQVVEYSSLNTGCTGESLGSFKTLLKSHPGFKTQCVF